MIDVGVMQGRLLLPFEGRFQAFPAKGWQEEFALAARAGIA
ncbi:MAG: sugar phosphate isomerase/epimerase, partial [Rhodospirillales bacterium]